MTNVLNSAITNKPVHPVQKDVIPQYTLHNDSDLRPLEYRGKLLPSRIFGSPIEYVKDLKQDVVNIGRAATGKANDHELGRINDLAMKLGSLGLAAYLFVKNPLKLSKTMEFVGFSTFFASMALWPKLAIQAPLKLRTGVDIHQKYIDSQGRKKMLHQDPQYDLTDLYSREDLDRMGKKLKVSENLPDRDNFIKQRAKKTAIQGNTLWMMSSFSAPIMSALACNVLEKPIQNGIEKFDLAASAKQLEQGSVQGPIVKLKQKLSENALNKFIQQNADKPLDSKLIKELAAKLGANPNSAALQDAIQAELANLKSAVKIDETFVRKALSNQFTDDMFAALTAEQRNSLNAAIESGSFQKIASVLSKNANGKHAQRQLNNTIIGLLEDAKKSAQNPTLASVSDRVKTLYSSLNAFGAEKGVLDKFINVRVGDNAGSYLAHQWGRVGDKLIKSLKLNSSELKAISNGNMDILADKLAKLAANEAEFDKAISELTKLIGDYESKTNATFMSKVKQKAQSICVTAGDRLQKEGFEQLSDKVISAAKPGTIENIINTNTAERVVGAQSSFYRLMQALDLFKNAKDGILQQQITKVLKEQGQNADDAVIEKITNVCKKVVLGATTTDYVEKLMSSGFNLSESEYKTVMRVLFDNNSEISAGALEQSLQRTFGSEKAAEMLKGFKSYKNEFTDKISNWTNNVTKELSRRVATGSTASPNAIERNNLAGKTINQMVKDFAEKSYNSKMWLKVFGISMAVITAVTLIAGLAIGRKTKMEKQVEAESKVNG